MKSLKGINRYLSVGVDAMWIKEFLKDEKVAYYKPWLSKIRLFKPYELREDMEALSALPMGTHIGQLDVSWMKDSLPPQFLMHYDYEFLYQMFCTLQHMIQCAKNGTPIIAQSVMEELIIYLCNAEGIAFIEMDGKVDGEEFQRDDLEEWVFDLFGDSDLITFLYSNIYLDKYHTYHFSYWHDLQFHVKR